MPPREARHLDSVVTCAGLVGRWPDADVVLQGGMSEGLRDWDLGMFRIGALCSCMETG